MSFILGDDIHGLPVEWRTEEGNQNMLTISGNHGSGKTMLADSIMLQALAAQYAVIRFDFEGKPLPSPIVSQVDYEAKAETLEVLDRTVAEIRRRGTCIEKHGVEGEPTPRPLLLVFEERLREVETGISGLRVYLMLVSSTFPMEEHSLLKNVISHSGHVHLGYSPIEEYVLPSNREQASHLITRLAYHSFQLLPGQGFYEDRFGALKPISQPHAFEGGNHNA